MNEPEQPEAQKSTQTIQDPGNQCILILFP